MYVHVLAAQEMRDICDEMQKDHTANYMEASGSVLEYYQVIQYICVCVCVCVCLCVLENYQVIQHIYIYIYIYVCVCVCVSWNTTR
jgi:hypothetical protein